jgi:hypothetical protein
MVWHSNMGLQINRIHVLDFSVTTYLTDETLNGMCAILCLQCNMNGYNDEVTHSLVIPAQDIVVDGKMHHIKHKSCVDCSSRKITASEIKTEMSRLISQLRRNMVLVEKQ